MGSHMKKSIFDEQTSKAIKKWHMAIKKKPNTTRVLGAQGHSDSESPRVISTDNNGDHNVSIRVEQGGQNIELIENGTTRQ